MAVNNAVNRWNLIYGRKFGAVVVPTHWKLHSTAEHGGRPQEALNEQLVKNADILVALFWHRLGSTTGVAESGTVEEINEAHESGAYVAILSCSRDWPRDADTTQVEALRAFYEEIRSQSLVLDYADAGDLARHVDAILTQAVTRSNTRAEISTEVSPDVASAEPLLKVADVWPRIESSESVNTDSKGRVKTERRWSIVLSNTGKQPARNVRYRLEPEDEGDGLPMDLGDDRGLEILAPASEASYPIVLYSGVASQARCVVTWEDGAGEHENQATLRFY
jgi:hypothetical protein